MSSESLGGAEKAAVVVLSLDPDAARSFLGRMADDEVERILRAVSRIEEIDTETRMQVLEEFQQTLAQKDGILSGGRDRALALIEGGIEGSRAARLRESLDSNGNGIDGTLRGYAAEFLAEALALEHPQTLAVVLAQMSAQRGAGVIGALPPEQRADVVLRLADLDGVDPEIVCELSDGIEELFGRTSGESTQIGGRDAAARLLNLVSKESGDSILEIVDGRDAELAQQIRKRMLTFDDLSALDPKGFQSLLREVSSEDLVVALKTASETMRDKVFANISSRAADQLREDSDLLGPMKLSDVEAVQERIVEAARSLEEQGALNLDFAGGGDDVLV